jgi:glycosyltransferase involved in cell wall biosynthesis
MKIAIMMRPMDQDSGFRAYTEALVDQMVKQDKNDLFLLFYRKPKYYGRYPELRNVKELLLKAPSKFLWDQAAVPYAAWKEGADVIFHPKFSIPLVSPCPVTMGLQEPAWWTEPELYEKWDVRYEKVMVPLCIHRSAHIFPMSNFILEENRRVLRMPLENTTVVYAAPDEHFRPCSDPQILESFREKYALPKQFILSVTRVDHPGLEGSTSFYPGKRPEILFRAYTRIRDQVPHQLVFAGRRVREYLQHMEGEEVDLRGVHFITFVPYEELHLLYNSAEVFVNPAPYEGCSNTVLQAMACGRPLVLSNSGGCADVGREAAMFVRPKDEVEFAEKILSVLTNPELWQELSARSLKRASQFSYAESARLALDILAKVVEKSNSRKSNSKLTVSPR